MLEVKSVNKFDKILYQKENRTAWPLLFFIESVNQLTYFTYNLDLALMCYQSEPKLNQGFEPVLQHVIRAFAISMALTVFHDK